EKRMRRLKTRTGTSEFCYERMPDGSIVIQYGSGSEAALPAQKMQELLRTFSGRTVASGTSRDAPPRDSVGAWLQQNVTRTAIASYVLPILVAEGMCTWAGSGKVRFKECED